MFGLVGLIISPRLFYCPYLTSKSVEIERKDIVFKNSLKYHCLLNRKGNRSHIFLILSFTFSHLFISETKLYDFPIIFL